MLYYVITYKSLWNNELPLKWNNAAYFYSDINLEVYIRMIKFYLTKWHKI